MSLVPRPKERGLIAGRDHRARLLAALALALVSVFIHQPASALLFLLLGLALALIDGNSPGTLARRLLLLQFLMLSLLLTLPFQVPGEILGQVVGMGYSREGLILALVIFCKANGVALALLGLLSSMEPMHLGRALARLGAPDKLAHLLMLGLRQIHLLQLEYQRLNTAMRARGFVPGSNRHSWRSYGQLMGMLLVRALDRSKRLGAAMRARGFDGRFYLLEDRDWQRTDGLFLATLIGLGAGLLVLEHHLLP